MLTIKTDITVAPGAEIDFFASAGLASGDIVYIQNKTAATSVLLRTVTSTGYDGLVLPDNRIFEITVGDTLFVKNTGFSTVTLAVAIG